MTTDASVYKIVADMYGSNEDLRAQLLEVEAIADALYDSLIRAVATDAIPRHSDACVCNLCTVVARYKEYKWKMTL